MLLLILHVGLGGCRYTFEFTSISLFLICDVHICFELLGSVQIMPNPLRKIFVAYRCKEFRLYAYVFVSASDRFVRRLCLLPGGEGVERDGFGMCKCLK